MSGKINEYALERYEFGDQDYYDIDYYDIANNVYKSAKILGSTIRNGINPKLFAQVESLTPAFTGNVEGSIIGGGVGSLSVPENTFQKGDSYRFAMTGTMSTSTNDFLQFYIKVNGTTFADSGQISMPQLNSQGFRLEIDFTIRDVGGLGYGAVFTNAEFTYRKDSGMHYEGEIWNSSETSNFDTTILNVLDVTAVFSSNDPANIIQSETCVLHKTY